jgi:predicted DNA-binding transcriptional regulator AlpA
MAVHSHNGRTHMDSKDAYTIPEFCARHGLSRSALYNAWRDGKGPTQMRVGDKVLISREAAEEWRRQCERDAQEAPPSRPRGRHLKHAVAA